MTRESRETYTRRYIHMYIYRLEHDYDYDITTKAFQTRYDKSKDSSSFFLEIFIFFGS